MGHREQQVVVLVCKVVVHTQGAAGVCTFDSAWPSEVVAAAAAGVVYAAAAAAACGSNALVVVVVAVAVYKC